MPDPLIGTFVQKPRDGGRSRLVVGAGVHVVADSLDPMHKVSYNGDVSFYPGGGPMSTDTPTPDIVAELRAGHPLPGSRLLRAADEIVRLRAALVRIVASGAYPEAAIAQDALASGEDQ